MTNHELGRALKQSPRGARAVHGAMLVAFIVSLLASAFVWLLPLEVAQQWALDRAGKGQFEQFEAVGEAEFSLWLLRVVSTLLPLLIWYVWSDLNGWRVDIAEVWHGLLAITKSPSPAKQRWLTPLFSLRTVGGRGLLIAWFVLFVAHAAHGIGQRIHEWPYFRFNSGNVVLPNISDSNRAVIRYLQEVTPLNARILVTSDQKLFFLSYYLRPRTLLHRMHPDSEHVIPLKEQLRKLNAYRLDELTASDLEQMPHDYTLEYFEHPDMVDRGQVLDDKSWVAFMRRREQNPSLIPAYLVRLKAAEENRR